MPDISVIIPAYNCAAYLPEMAESLKLQSFQDWEAIVVDDGSTDNTADVMRDITAADARFLRVYQSNKGMSGARNTGLRLSHAKYVAVLDSDDKLAPNALAVMRGQLEESGADWCVIDIMKFWEGFEERRNSQVPAGTEDLLANILRGDFIRRAMFFRREALVRIGLYDEAMYGREDWDLNIRLIQAKAPCVYVREPLYWYRKRPDSVTTGVSLSMLTCTEQLLEKHHIALARVGNPWLRPVIASHYWTLARAYYHRNLKAPALRCMVKSALFDFDLKRLLHPLIHRLRKG